MATEEEFEGLKISGTKLSWAGADRSEIPQRLAERYGESATQLDMSYNCITFVQCVTVCAQLASPASS